MRATSLISREDDDGYINIKIGQIQAQGLERTWLVIMKHQKKGNNKYKINVVNKEVAWPKGLETEPLQGKHRAQQT